ncbi:Uncharacterised protein [Tatumella ptyseos]|uniref:Uncharacterized protein n=1 Tax=Tatumella ptyseos TaxID=82987 RepID=A0A2X5NRG9_9GAMM|nr:Uncharacterised protein [Tatumella ptyseos]
MKQKILQTQLLQLMCQPHTPGKCQKTADLKRLTGDCGDQCAIIAHYNNAKHQHGAPSSTFQLLKLLIKIGYLMDALTPAHQ